MLMGHPKVWISCLHVKSMSAWIKQNFWSDHKFYPYQYGVKLWEKNYLQQIYSSKSDKMSMG